MAKGGQIIGENGLIVLAQRRGAGEVEVHENTNHVFIVVEGEATFVTGDSGGAKNTAPGPAPRRERAGRADISPYQRRRDHDSGKTPHWFKEVPTQTIAYYAVNLEP